MNLREILGEILNDIKIIFVDLLLMPIFPSIEKYDERYMVMHKNGNSVIVSMRDQKIIIANKTFNLCEPDSLDKLQETIRDTLIGNEYKCLN